MGISEAFRSAAGIAPVRYREGGEVKQEGSATARIAGGDGRCWAVVSLLGQRPVPAEEAFQIERSLPHGKWQPCWGR